MNNTRQQASKFRSIFSILMLFTGLAWLITIASLSLWPWTEQNSWQPDLPLAVTCSEQKTCAIAFGELKTALAEGKVLNIRPALANGELETSDSWLQWQTVTGKAWQYEVKRSSWYFETKVRYRIDNDQPVLVEFRTLDNKVLGFAAPISAVIVGIVLFVLRKKLGQKSA